MFSLSRACDNYKLYLSLLDYRTRNSPSFHREVSINNVILRWSGRSSGVEWSGLKNWPGHCVVFLDKTLYFHSDSLHPGVQMGMGRLSGKPDEILGVTL